MVSARAGVPDDRVGGPVFALLPLLGMLALLAYLSGQARSAAELQSRATRAWELAMIRRYREALGQAWELLPACRTKPQLHGRAVTVFAHVLGELGREEAAEVAYRYLLDRLPPEHPLALRMKLQQAMAALTSGRLADGDDILRKLRGPIDSSPDKTLDAAYHLAKLVQDVYTGHYADALQNATQTEIALVPLGVEAGYGYALLARCAQQRALHLNDEQRDQQPQLLELAQRLWRQATLLIPASALAFRFPELRELMQDDEA